jgi:SpoVK/Ycf46/Vps4 family AAA+-type ATPase
MSASETSPVSAFTENLRNHIAAGYQVLAVGSLEEARLQNELHASITALKAAGQGQIFEGGLITWSAVSGFSSEEQIDTGPAAVTVAPSAVPAQTRNALAALRRIVDPNDDRLPRTCLVLLHDLSTILDIDPAVRRALKQFIEEARFNNRDLRRPVLLVQGTDTLHADVQPYVHLLDYPLPSLEDRLRYVDQTRGRMTSQQRSVPIPDDLREAIARSLSGLTEKESVECLALGLIRHKAFKPELLTTIEESKAQQLKRSSALTYIPRAKIPPMSEFGGYDLLKGWLAERKLAYTAKARELGLLPPKGILLAGPPGTGKSRISLALAAELGLPMVTFDFGSVFDKLVGSSERRMREALQVVTALGGCVLQVDEADKALGGASTAGGDGGVTQRLFGRFLSWLAEKEDDTFVVMTMNRVDNIPVELLRKGRLSELFFVDLPSVEERREILSIHLRKRGIAPDLYSAKEWKSLLDATPDFVGAELEDLVVSGQFRRFAADGTARPTCDDLLSCAAATVPIARVDQDSIKQMRDWGLKRARPVSSASAPSRTLKSGQRVVRIDDN